MIHPFAKQLATERKTIGISVLELADRSGYSEGLIAKVESGQRALTFGSLNALAGALGYDVVLQRKERP